MLVITRKLNEEILIGDDIKVTVVKIAGEAVRIGIEAPRSLDVDRPEVRERKVRERNQGSSGEDPSV